MATKKCRKCNKDKDESEFYLKKNGRLHSYCNDCRKEDKKAWDVKNKEHTLAYKERTKEHRFQQAAEYREKNREKLRAVASLYNKKLKEKRKEYWSKPEIQEKRRQWARLWREKNRVRYNRYFHDYYERDAAMKAVRNLRHKLYKILKGSVSPLHSKDLVGCDLAAFKLHLESHFTEGMRWDNYGFGADKWNVHHEPPLASYDYSNPDSYKEAFHWTHSFPKWMLENISENSWYQGVKYFYKKQDNEKD